MKRLIIILLLAINSFNLNAAAGQPSPDAKEFELSSPKNLSDFCQFSDDDKVDLTLNKNGLVLEFHSAIVFEKNIAEVEKLILSVLRNKTTRDTKHLDPYQKNSFGQTAFDLINIYVTDPAKKEALLNVLQLAPEPRTAVVAPSARTTSARSRAAGAKKKRKPVKREDEDYEANEGVQSSSDDDFDDEDDKNWQKPNKRKTKPEQRLTVDPANQPTGGTVVDYLADRKRPVTVIPDDAAKEELLGVIQKAIEGKATFRRWDPLQKAIVRLGYCDEIHIHFRASTINPRIMKPLIYHVALGCMRSQEVPFGDCRSNATQPICLLPEYVALLLSPRSVVQLQETFGFTITHDQIFQLIKKHWELCRFVQDKRNGLNPDDKDHQICGVSCRYLLRKFYEKSQIKAQFAANLGDIIKEMHRIFTVEYANFEDTGW